MNDSLRSRSAIRQYVEAVPRAEWTARVRTLTVESAQALVAGQIDDATYEVWGKEIARRQDRHLTAARSVHDRFEGEPATFARPGSAIVGMVAALPDPAVTQEGPNRRGPSPLTAEERLVRRLQAREQADKRKMPAALSKLYTRGQLAAISVIIHRVSRFGACALAVASIAGIAGVSVRTVRDAVAIGRRAGHIEVTAQDRAPNLITAADPRIRARLPDGGTTPYPATSKRENSSVSAMTKRPRKAANSTLIAEASSAYVPKVARGVPEPESVPVAPVQDEAEETRRETLEADLAEMEWQGHPQPQTPLEAVIADWRAVVIERERDGANDPSTAPL